MDNNQETAGAVRAEETTEAAVARRAAANAMSNIIDVHRRAIEKHERHVLETRRWRDTELRRLDDELFVAEREFLTLRGKVEREKAEIAARAENEIGAHETIARMSQQALVAAGAKAGE